MTIIKPADSIVLTQACQLLEQGDVVAMPTETVYGLAADAYQEAAIARIYQVKNRPQFNPLIIHYPSAQEAVTDVDFTQQAERLAAESWPGPLTLILPRRASSKIALLASAGLDSLAIRIPAHPVTQQLLQQYGRPLAAPSANLSNTISPTSAADVEQSLGDRIPLILDGGPCLIGVESTILDLTDASPTLLRPGGITIEQLEAVLKQPVSFPSPSFAVKAPGMLKRHYAPSLPLRLNALEPQTGEVYLSFGSSHHGPYSLSESGDLSEAAANLFRLMRFVDQENYSGIAVAPIPSHGLGLAINDRLNRAAYREKV
jgi:L-threonylcarbamoyladenylate synthase